MGEPTVTEAMDAAKLTPPPKCERCGREDISVDTCCSSHAKELCNSCYNTTHFVELP